MRRLRADRPALLASFLALASSLPAEALPSASPLPSTKPALRLAAPPSPGPASPSLPAPSGGRSADVLFRWAAGGLIRGSPITGEGVVWFLSDDGALYGIDDSPRVLFRASGFSPKARFSPARGGAMLASDGDALIRLNRAGAVTWKAYLPGSGGEGGLAAPAEGRDGRVFSGGASLLCRSATGSALWDRRLAAPLTAGPKLDERGNLVIALADGSLESWTAFGKRLWRLEGKTAVRDIALRAGGVAALRADGQAFLVDGSAASPSWGHPLETDCISLCASPEASPNASWYLLSRSGRLDALDSSGAALWSLEGGPGVDAVCAYPGRAYLTGKGRVLAVTRQGEALKELALTASSGMAAVSRGGSAYSGGLDWILYAYRFDPDRSRDYGKGGGEDESGYGLVEAAPDLDDWGGPSRASLAARLDDVEKSLKSGNMDDEARALNQCAAVGLSSILAPRVAGGQLLAAPSDLRARACSLLGATGSLEARPVLLRIVREDADPSVRAAAVDALGLVAWDADGASAEAIAATVSPAADPLREAEAYAAAVALERISLYEGVPLSAAGTRALIRMAEGAWPAAVRQRAEAALKAIVTNSRPAGGT